MQLLDREVCYRALRTRDPRFDGRFFTAVRTTGIYCRPICPAPTPHLENCTFYPSAAAAQAAGYRPCLRCRPEASPEHAVWRGTANTVSQALACIADGALDDEAASVETLAERLGVGGRHLRRLFHQHVGASPVAVAQTRRLLLAKQLLSETRLPIIDVATAAGFRSVRRFNDAFRNVYRRSPNDVRHRRHPDRLRGGGGPALKIFLPYRPPYDWAAMLAYLARRTIDGVEKVDEGGYHRSFLDGGQAGVVAVVPARGRHGLDVTLTPASPRALPAVVRRVRRLFDLSADVDAIDAHLATDPVLAPLVARRPGLRAPGSWDGFELAVRAVLGQQVTLEAARRLLSKLVAAFGAPLEVEGLGASGLTRLFPSAERLVSADLTSLGMPTPRARCVSALAGAAVADPAILRAGPSLDDALPRLRQVPGVGEWTAQYIALRAFGETDAFPASDVGLLRACQDRAGRRPSPEQLAARAEAWRPWRAYAAQHLWAAGEGGASLDGAMAEAA